LTDESNPKFYIKTNMAPLRGWGPRGQRLKALVPYGHWKTMTFLAALRHDRIDAPCVLDGPINGELFRLYVTEVLVPTREPGDIVVLDTLRPSGASGVLRSVLAKDAPCAPPSEPPGRAFSSCRPTAPTLIRSSKSSQSSSTCCERLASEPSKTHGSVQVPSSTTSHPENAKTISPTGYASV